MSAAGPFVAIHRLRFSDTDRLGHVNNAVFGIMLEQGRSEPGDVRIETEIVRGRLNPLPSAVPRRRCPPKSA